MKKTILLSFLVILFLLPFTLADRPESKDVNSLTEINMLNEIKFGQRTFFSVRLLDATGSPVTDAPCTYATYNDENASKIIESYELKPTLANGRPCITGLPECYFTSNSYGDLQGFLDIGEVYYDRDVNYGLFVFCDDVNASTTFKVIQRESIAAAAQGEWDYAFNRENMDTFFFASAILIFGGIFIYLIMIFGQWFAREAARA